MTKVDCIVLGGTGLIGSQVCAHLAGLDLSVLPVTSKDYATKRGARGNMLINCNGNAARHLAQKDPMWDFEASVTSVERSLFDFAYDRYLYLSTVDVYREVHDPSRNDETAEVRSVELHPYAFHKWLAERLVERFAPRWMVARLGTVIGAGLKKNPVYDLLNGHPLRVSLESELTLIDTVTIARCIETLIQRGGDREIYNVAATGAVRLRELQDRLGRPASLEPGAEQIVHRYSINNNKMASLTPMPTSWEALEAFLERAGIRLAAKATRA
jgi:nucleoside-diphosphate-sugar epimerase